MKHIFADYRNPRSLIGETTEIEVPGIERVVAVFNALLPQGASFPRSDGVLAMDPARCDEVYARLAGERNA